MTNDEILIVLKTDLEIAVTSRDDLLNKLIDLSKAAIEREGITIQNNTEDGMLVERYAAFLFRKRREDTVAMPRSLRFQLNNRLLSEKARANEGN